MNLKNWKNKKVNKFDELKLINKKIGFTVKWIISPDIFSKLYLPNNKFNWNITDLHNLIRSKLKMYL